MPFFGKMQNWRYSPADSCISVQHTQKMAQKSGEVHKETGLGRGEKLAFVSAHQIYDVIASQFANWRGNPPDEWDQEMITTKNDSVSLSCRAIVDTFSF